MHKRTNSRQFCGIAVLGILSATSAAMAGSLTNMERSTTAQGASFAGASSNASDVSYSSQNPAALRSVETVSVAASGNLKIASHKGTVSTGGNVDAGRTYFLGMGQVGFRLNEHLVFGLSVDSPYDLNTDYGSTFVGAGDATSSRLRTVAFTPMISWDINDAVTVAAGVNILQTDIRYASTGINIRTDGVEFGGIFGLIWEAMPGTKLGLTYQTGYSADLSGTAIGPATGGVLVPADYSFNLPETLTAGLTHGVSDTLRFMAEVQWRNWSTHDTFSTSLNNGMAVSTDPQNYNDSFFVAGGLEYDQTQDLTLRGGVAWEQSPVDDGILPGTPSALGITNQTVRVPNGDRLWMSGGLSYKVLENVIFDFAYSYIHGLNKEVIGLRTAPGTSISFKNGEHSLSMGIRGTF